MKNKLRQSFNKAWKTYDLYSQIQQRACDKAIKVLLQHGNRYSLVADFACGTGLSTQSLLGSIQTEKILAIDFSEKFLQVASNKNMGSKVQIIHADFDELRDDTADLDLIFCNMGLQWSPNILFTLRLFHSYLKTNGLLVFSLPMDSTFTELKEPYRNAFYTPESLKDRINESGFNLFSFEEFTTVDQFDNPVKALRSIKFVGANCLVMDDDLRKKGLSRSAVKNMFVSHNNFNLSYRIGIFVIKKVVSL